MPDDEFMAVAVEAAQNATAEIQVVPGEGESLPFEDATFDAVSVPRRSFAASCSQRRPWRNSGAYYAEPGKFASWSMLVVNIGWQAP
ncbi:MAG: class I SAM-dependent methyltransferase [Nitrospirae bacterium]|nr:class I SAM-dependent methyltransferase [Nitrospirota bacterium]